MYWYMQRLANFIKAVFEQVVENAEEYIFGAKVAHYFVRIEFQYRGAPHAHMMIWLEDPP
jgi:hypothetical protein